VAGTAAGSGVRAGLADLIPPTGHSGLAGLGGHA
jgi:hypothetical protein